jgi:hypothetical protein
MSSALGCHLMTVIFSGPPCVVRLRTKQVFFCTRRKLSIMYQLELWTKIRAPVLRYRPINHERQMYWHKWRPGKHDDGFNPFWLNAEGKTEDALNKIRVQPIDYRYEDGRFLVSENCATISNPH